MNRVNPLHVIALTVVLILFVFFQLSNIKSELAEQKEAYKKSELIAKELVAYKKFYADKKRLQKSFQRILSQGSLKKTNLKIAHKKDGVKVTAKAIDLYALNSLLSKIFNGAYRIKRLNIQAVDATHAKLDMEIQW